jgi:hypothetical protein
MATVEVMQPAQVLDRLWRRLSAPAMGMGITTAAPMATAEGTRMEAAGVDTRLCWSFASKCVQSSHKGKPGNVCLAATEIFKLAVIIARMQLLTEYLERALSLGRLAANEPQSESKKSLLRQPEPERWRPSVPRITACPRPARQNFHDGVYTAAGPLLVPLSPIQF